MDLRQLAAVIAVSEGGSFSAAARTLHTVQSNISTHIARLERELGAPLVDRASGTLTEAGQVVVERARRIQHEVAAITADIAALNDEITGNVRLGCIGTVGRWLVPLVLERATERHPNLHVVVVDATTTSLVPQLLSDDLDLAVVNLPLGDPDLVSEPLFDEDRLVIAPTDHPLAGRGSVTFTELSEHELLLEPVGTSFRDELDTGLADNPLGLPSGDREVAFAIQDRMFTADGQLHYPALPQTRTSPDPSVQPEFFGDVILVNGQAWPKLDVQRRKYRFRILNGSDSRFYSLKLNRQGGRPLTVWAIGTDGGLLAAPVELKGALVIAPGERMDVIVDFAEAGMGERIVVTNNAPTPFPFGAPVVPPANQIMAFDVSHDLPAGFVDLPLPATLRSGGAFTVGEPARTRELLLFEGADELGRIFALLGTAAGGFRQWNDPVTETVPYGDVEEWVVYNTTPDAHPIHVHLPQFQLLWRAPFKATQDRSGALRNIRLGAKAPAPAWERGPKDTAQMLPGEATAFRAKFDRAGEYVWHCHILSHEDHEMMRRYTIG